MCDHKIKYRLFKIKKKEKYLQKLQEIIFILHQSI